ncbi:MAG TPA: ATP-dependent DNA ligase [Planctomycetota bacterium]|nr:ATP-dependent DNA ligase [Planctomycetota bacterium]
MRLFARLYGELDETTRTNDKVAALARYFREAPPADAAWALRFLSGARPKRSVPTGRMVMWAAEAAGIPLWLAEQCIEATGDTGEALALIIPDPPVVDPPPLHELVEHHLLPLARMADDERRAALARVWARLDRRQRLLWHKLIGGEFRVGVSRALVVRALAEVAGVDAAVLAHRLTGAWQPTAAAYQRLLSPDATPADDVGRPYPFFLAHPLQDDPATLGAIGEWQAEWKWDGIRAQLIRRRGESAIWSRGEELVTDQFPEIADAAAGLDDGTVLDGEILAWDGERPRAFAALQRRLNRRGVSAKMMNEVPLAFMAYDLLEERGADLRALPMDERRARLEALIARCGAPRFRLSPLVAAASWDDLAVLRQEARERDVEGLMLKRRTSAYGVGRTVGTWWKWKVAPYTVDAVLIYAQPGHGQRAGLYTDYTFAVWRGDQLVPVAKAYSGLTVDEIHAVDRFVRAHTVERFGPVRQVEPELVFELAFEGIQRSTRHKSGIAVRFPRMARWRHDKKPADADRIETLEELIDAPGQPA